MAARALAAETGNREFDVRLRRLGLQLAVVAGEPFEEPPLAWELQAFLETAPAAHRAQVLRWLAWRHWQRGELPQAGERLAEAREAASMAGLEGLTAELGWLAGELALAGPRPGEAAAEFDTARAAAERLGQGLTLVLAEAGCARVSGDARALRTARRRFAALLADLGPDEREAFLAFPERRALAAPDAEGAPPETLALLADLAADVAGAADLDTVLDRALAAMRELTGAERAWIALYDGFQEVARLASGDDDDLEFSTTLAQEVVWQRQPVVVSDVAADARFAESASLHAVAVRMAAGVPLLDGDEVVGVLAAASRDVGLAWSSAELGLAAALGRVVAQAVRQARRHEAARRERQQLAAALDFATGLLGLGERGAIAGAATAALRRLLGAERAFLALPAWERVLGEDGAEWPLADAPLGHTIVDWTMRERVPSVIVDVEQHATAGTQSVMALGLRTVVAVPVLHDDACLGVLYADSRRLLEVSPATEQLLGRLGLLLGQALARA
jgi:GAF domain-containing protein